MSKLTEFSDQPLVRMLCQLSTHNDKARSFLDKNLYSVTPEKDKSTLVLLGKKKILHKSAISFIIIYSVTMTALTSSHVKDINRI